MWTQCRNKFCRKNLKYMGDGNIGFCDACVDKMHPIRFLRKARKLEQKQMSYILGISQSSLSMVENNKFNVSYNLLDKLHLELDVDLNKFVESMRYYNKQVRGYK